MSLTIIHLLAIAALPLSLLGYFLVVGTSVWFRVTRVRRPAPDTRFQPPVSILVPLKGTVATLEANLTSFAQLDYANLQLVVGSEDPEDAALTVARRVAARFPEREFCVVGGATGRGSSPLVRVLQGLVQHARHDVLLKIDDEVELAPDFLQRGVAALCNPNVGLCHTPVIGVGEESAAAALENFTLLSFTCMFTIFLKLVCGISAVSGKCFLLRRSALEDAGGFRAVGCMAADDHSLADKIRAAGWKIVLLGTIVRCVHRQRAFGAYFSRHLRWMAMRKWISVPAYVLECLASPLISALWICLLLLPFAPVLGLYLVLLATIIQLLVGSFAVWLLRGSGPRWRHLPLVLVKDLILEAMWWITLFSRKVDWRGQAMYLAKGARLVDPRVYQRARAVFRRQLARSGKNWARKWGGKNMEQSTVVEARNGDTFDATTK